jgi:uncharacterized protein
MTNYYLDTSALAKHYLTEVGSTWIKALIDATAGNVIVVCDLTAVELVSMLARRQREGSLTPANVLILQSRLLADFEREYISVPLDSETLNQARELLIRYPMRSLDAIQLAGAVEAVNALAEPITFISADKNLLMAAAGEGFGTDNPNVHP